MKTDNSNIVVESLEDTIGYQLAISFKPFINPACKEHMQIVKDMALSINRALNSSKAKAQVFSKGYLEGKKWQKQEMVSQLKELNNAGTLIEFVINAIPTGSTRNLLTDANILLKTAIEKINIQ